MKKIILRNDKNKKFSSDLVRYFRCQNDDYLIYTFGEKDEKDFIKLYVVKVMEELGTPVAKTLSADWEWEKIQLVVKQMLKELKSGKIESFTDLEVDFIQGLKVLEARSFKLSKLLVEILSGDKVCETVVEKIGKPTSKTDTVLPKSEKDVSSISHSTTQKQVSQDELELKEKLAFQKLQQENELLKKRLLQYQVKYQTLKDLLTKDE